MHPRQRGSSEGNMAALLSSMVDPMHSGARSPVRMVQQTPMVEGKNDTNEFVSHVMLSPGPEARGNAHAVVRVSLLGAGFVCGVGGRNISAIQRRTGVMITSSVSKMLVGGVRVFKVSGDSAGQVKSAVAIMEEAVGVYKSLTEGDFQGQFVEPEVSIQGITFSYAPPPKDKMPKAACVKQLPQSLATRKGAASPNHQLSHQSSYQSTYQSSHQSSYQSHHSTMDRSSSVDSNESHASLHRERLDERWNEDGCLNHGYNLEYPNAEYTAGYNTEYAAGCALGYPAGCDVEHQPRHGGRHTGGRRPLRRPSMMSMMARSLSDDRSRARQVRDPPSPYNSGSSMRTAYSMPFLSEMTNRPDPDRADRDWRQGGLSAEDTSRPPRARSLLNDFQGMRM